MTLFQLSLVPFFLNSRYQCFRDLVNWQKMDIVKLRKKDPVSIVEKLVNENWKDRTQFALKRLMMNSSAQSIDATNSLNFI